MDLKFTINIDDLTNKVETFKEQFKADLLLGIKKLVGQINAHIKDEASKKLHSSYKLFLENYDMHETGANIWEFRIEKPALWIEEGLKPGFDMKEKILNGKRYRIIPFDWGKPPTQQPNKMKEIRSELSALLKQNKVSIDPLRIEKNSDGTPKIGKLHSFDFGGKLMGKGKTPVLQGVSIYQSRDQKTGNVRRDILTFRTMVADPGQSGMWKHPGYEGKKFLNEAQEWAESYWEKEMLPEILSRWK